MVETDTPQRLILSPDDAMDDSDISGDEGPSPPTNRVRAPRPSVLGRQSLAVATKRRRRSSILRSRLSIASSAAGPTPSEQHLGELYRKAIRMNAENRINAQNSWNLPLIEHIDKFLEEDDEEEEEEINETSRTPRSSKRVNFTKASCTLDASVKIYSFRVDDVHLTSYKVLANLNRNQKPNEKDDEDVGLPSEHDDDGEEGHGTKTPARKTSRSVQTLETNRANINLNRLDSAFDIDPLFHKMSKTFDEGGAKGLLLANLQTKNCSIVFDSSEEEAASNVSKTEPNSVDIQSLQTKLESTLEEEPLESLPLVPQLASLRAEYEILQSQGFVLLDNSPKTKRFLPSSDEEELADKSIHQDALERSTRTPAKSIIRDDDDDESNIDIGGISNFNISPQGEFAADDYAADDFGGGGDDDDDDHFVSFMNQEQRYSGISFSAGSRIDDASDGNPNPFGDDEPSPTTALLDALANNNLLSQSSYTYLNERALSRIENLWAGAPHWKPTRKLARSQPAATAAEKKKKAPRKKATKERVFVCFTEAPDLSSILQKPPRKKKGADPLVMSSAMIKKHAATLNLLPLDAGIGVDQFTKLFLRPDTVISSVNAAADAGTTNQGPVKSVAFDMTGNDAWGNDDDDDGPGFTMNDDGSIDDENQDFCIRDLEDVRRVEKVRVGYATVAKKVDVKRLKRDLWNELEERLRMRNEEEEADVVMEEDEKEAGSGGGVSFQQAVSELEHRKTQPDATLSFYFISVLHLANEKGLRLESKGLNDFEIFQDEGAVGSNI